MNTPSKASGAAVLLGLLACSGSQEPQAIYGSPDVMGADQPPPSDLVLPDLRALSDRPDDCMLDLDGLTPKLAEQQAGGENVTVDRGARVVETFTMSDGTPVRVSQGGCSHIGIAYDFGLRSTPDDPYAKALELLAQLKLAPLAMSMHDTLKEAGELGEDGVFPCGEAYCTVSVKTDGENPVLSVDYDFAL